MFRPKIHSAFAFLATLAVSTFTLPEPASAHDWYPVECCSDKDCAPIDGNADVSATAEGWVVQATGEVIAYDDRRIRMTPRDVGNSFHRCTMGGLPEGRTICLFVPALGS
jgi:hypothetical protein